MDDLEETVPAADTSHRRIDADQWATIYVVGDVHGCRVELETLLRTLDPAADDLVVFVGDLIRKGPDSQGVVELVRGMENAMSVMGNNEPKLFRGDASLPALTDADRAYLESLPTVISWAGNAVVHGGVDPDRPLADHDAEDLRNMRNPRTGGDYDRPFWWEYYEGPPRVFFGHTPLEAPVYRPDAIGLDTGCVYGGSLTAYDTARDRFVNVPARETYQERDDDKTVSPLRTPDPQPDA
ncbi:metallophosphoesterase [Halococcus sp. IIIV-5B]|uniref:metallophosphoesterase n=1 Tax=Halococcus sp. IIIV-5B TaxID=2321230 RepID=UPI000E75DC7D|nr:metallophosphoesterase [Halococcus sp. IIIV-5B]RJT03151.1 serine/threonine protein phosphatase [Halococcus sp. IIIV-5B]